MQRARVFATVNGFRLAALASLAAALAVFGYAVSTGQARVGLFFVIPFVTGTGLLPLVGMLLVFAAFVLWSIGTVRTFQEHAGDHGAWEAAPAREAQRGDEERGTRRAAKSGGVILLGPIPIVWGSDRRVLPWMIAAGAALMLLALLLTFSLRG